MKNKFIRTLSALLLTGALAIGLSACGGNSTSNNSTESESAETESLSTEETSEVENEKEEAENKETEMDEAENTSAESQVTEVYDCDGEMFYGRTTPFKYSVTWPEGFEKLPMGWNYKDSDVKIHARGTVDNKEAEIRNLEFDRVLVAETENVAYFEGQEDARGHDVVLVSVDDVYFALRINGGSLRYSDPVITELINSIQIIKE